MLTPAQKGSIPPTPSIHRLPCGLPGYLILFAPHTFAPQRQLQSSYPPSPLVFLPISTHFTATPGIPLTSPALKPDSIQSNSHLKSRTFTQCQALVRFFALRRIKPHNPPLVRAPVNSFEFQPCGRTPQAECLLCLLRHRRGRYLLHLAFIVYSVDYQGI